MYLGKEAFLVEEADYADRFRRPTLDQVDTCLVIFEGDVGPVDALSLVSILLQLAQVPGRLSKDLRPRFESQKALHVAEKQLSN